MGALIRILFPLIGYFCVAATITTVAGYGYLRHNGILDDEKMFQIVSLVHGVDLEQIAGFLGETGTWHACVHVLQKGKHRPRRPHGGSSGLSACMNALSGCLAPN